MMNYIKYAIFPSRYESLSPKLSIKLLLAIYFVITLFSGLITFTDSYLTENNPAVDYGLAMVLFAVFFAIFIVAYLFFMFGVYALLSVVSQYVISRKGDKPSIRELVRIYVLANIPNVIMVVYGLFSAALTYTINFAGILDPIVIEFLNLINLALSLLTFIWYLYIVVRSIKAKYKTSLATAILAGAVPLVTLYVVMFVLAICALISFAVTLVALQAV